MKMARDYLCDHVTPKKELYKPFVALAMRSNARMCIIPIQDYLGYDNTCRMNKPSTVGTNWRWRVQEKELTEELQKEILHTTKTFGRMNWN